METTNHMVIKFDSRPQNESFARMAVAAALIPMNPTLEEMSDVKTAVSEAVTNSIIHGYEQKMGEILLEASIEGNRIRILVEDFGKGMEDVEKAMEPMYTTRPDLERSGMGFAFMEAFMDELSVESKPGKGTRVVMEKMIGSREGADGPDDSFA